MIRCGTGRGRRGGIAGGPEPIGEGGRRAPAGLPLLSPGRHGRPEQGSCVMEYVSVLAGGRFSDHPGCTHPRLAWLARRVNDGVDDRARCQLGALAPALIGTNRQHRAIPAVVLLELARAGLAAAPTDSGLRDVAELAARHVDHHLGGGDADGRFPRRRPWQPLCTVDRHALWGAVWAAVSPLPTPRRDGLLIAALVDTVVTTRHVLDLEPMPTGDEGRRHRSATSGAA